MASFKLTISNPKDGKTYQKEVKDEQAKPLIGLNIGEALKGDDIGLAGFELTVTGGSDYCGFPMRRGILGVRKKIKSKGGVGFRIEAKGIHKRKTVCSHKINENITQVNLKVTKQGSKGLAEALGAKEGEKEENKQEAKKEEKKEEKKPEPPKAQEKKEEPKKEEKK